MTLLSRGRSAVEDVFKPIPNEVKAEVNAAIKAAGLAAKARGFNFKHKPHCYAIEIMRADGSCITFGDIKSPAEVRVMLEERIEAFREDGVSYVVCVTH